MNTEHALVSAKDWWTRIILPVLYECVRIPNVSPAYDENWEAHGHMTRAVELLSGWARRVQIRGLSVEVVQLSGRTPLIYMEVPGNGPEGTVLLYGHCDKQPPFTGWDERRYEPDLPIEARAWTPVLEGDRLYGRGAADDGYAIFASLAALSLLHEQGVPHARCVILIEADEESGSDDLPFYVEYLAHRIGTPDIIVCLDSEAGNYEQLWMSTSLRGLVGGQLRVDVLTQGVHSGSASGIVPSSFLILMQLISRLVDIQTGQVLLPDLHVAIPTERAAQAAAMAEVLGDGIHREFPWVAGVRPMGTDLAELLLNRTWRPALSYTGTDGFPSLDMAGNVLRPYSTLKLSMRLPPGVDPQVAAAAMKVELERDPPYGTQVSFAPQQMAPGWNAPTLAPWLEASVDRASRTFFGKSAMAMGVGGTIPFMGMLGERFPQAQFLITGLLGPGANAHGPNEFLHIPTAERLTAVVAQVVADHAKR